MLRNKNGARSISPGRALLEHACKILMPPRKNGDHRVHDCVFCRAKGMQNRIPAEL